MKNFLIVFLVALGLSLGLTVLSVIVSYFRATLFSSFSLESAYASEVYGILFSIAVICVVFTFFFFFGIKTNTKVVKSITLALFVGVLLGSLAMLLPTRFTGSPGVSYLYEYVSFVTGFATSTVFQLFFPALAALLFAEIKDKNSNNPNS